MESFVDCFGNALKVGDIVLVLVPKSSSSYRKAIIRDFRSDSFHRQDIYVEYDDGRLYCDLKHWELGKNTVPSKIKFHSKPIKVWRCNWDVIKFDAKYFD